MHSHAFPVFCSVTNIDNPSTYTNQGEIGQPGGSTTRAAFETKSIVPTRMLVSTSIREPIVRRKPSSDRGPWPRAKAPG